MSERNKKEIMMVRNQHKQEIATLVEKHQSELHIVKSENTESY